MGLCSERPDHSGASVAVCTESVDSVDASLLPGVGERRQSGSLWVCLGLPCPFPFSLLQRSVPVPLPGARGRRWGRKKACRLSCGWGEPLGCCFEQGLGRTLEAEGGLVMLDTVVWTPSVPVSEITSKPSSFYFWGLSAVPGGSL